MRQLQKLQQKSTSADTVKAAVANAGQAPHEPYNKTCTACNKCFVVDKPFKAKHGLCFDCLVTPAGVVKLAETSARKDQARKRSQDHSNNVKVQAVKTDGNTAGQADGKQAVLPLFVTEADMLRMRIAQAEVSKAADTINGMMLKVVGGQMQPAPPVQQEAAHSTVLPVVSDSRASKHQLDGTTNPTHTQTMVQTVRVESNDKATVGTQTSLGGLMDAGNATTQEGAKVVSQHLDSLKMPRTLTVNCFKSGERTV
jgi:hypothetical protein